MKYLQQLPGAMYTVTETIVLEDGTKMENLVEKCRYSPHSLRATAITALAELGIPLIEIRDFAGHAQSGTTETYVYISLKVISLIFLKKSPQKWASCVLNYL